MNIIIFTIIIFLILLYFLDHFILRPFCEPIKSTSLWIAKSIILLNTELTKEEMSAIESKKLADDLFLSKAQYVLCSGTGNIIIFFSHYIRLAFYISPFALICAFFLVGSFDQPLFFILCFGIILTTFGILEKYFPQKKLQKRPLIYFLTFFEKHLDKIKISQENYDTIYFKVAQQLKQGVKELINLYRDYDIKPPTDEQARNVTCGDKKFLLECNKDFQNKYRIWKYSIKSSELSKGHL